jgi:hypothetical protein
VSASLPPVPSNSNFLHSHRGHDLLGEGEGNGGAEVEGKPRRCEEIVPGVNCQFSSLALEKIRLFSLKRDQYHPCQEVSGNSETKEYRAEPIATFARLLLLAKGFGGLDPGFELQLECC